MNTTTTSPVYNLLALFGDYLSGYALAYSGTRPSRDETRFEAGARIASTPGAVIPYDKPGHYSVASDDPKKPLLRYDVSALPGDLSCICPDGTLSKHNATRICKHQIAAVMTYALEEV